MAVKIVLMRKLKIVLLKFHLKNPELNNLKVMLSARRLLKIMYVVKLQYLKTQLEAMAMLNIQPVPLLKAMLMLNKAVFGVTLVGKVQHGIGTPEFGEFHISVNIMKCGGTVGAAVWSWDPTRA